jgi:hypothetical protein
MKLYWHFLTDGFWYWQKKVRVICWAFFVVYRASIATPHQARIPRRLVSGLRQYVPEETAAHKPVTGRVLPLPYAFV